MDLFGSTEFWLTRFLFQRALGFIYLLGFLIVVNQFRALVGTKGLLPAPLYLKRLRFWDAPSVFWASCSDRSFFILGWVGVVLSISAVSGFSDSHGLGVSMLTWFSLWAIYLSFVNIGQTFYGFGWESLLLETGFLSIFLGSNDIPPSIVLIWLLRWLLFRLMFGAGMIKIRGDSCWKDLTCMVYHYETQPLPNPLSPFFHRLPLWVHKTAVLFNHFVELIVPWGYFIPGPIGWVAAGFTFLFQFILILSGNLSWLNYITLVLCIPCLDDRFWTCFIHWNPAITTPAPTAYTLLTYAVGALILILSIRPAINLFSRRQVMNASFEPFHLVNTYGAFGSITRERMEIVIEGTSDHVITPTTRWQEYEFKGKPGDPKRRPCIVSPYHYRLDWQMWFAAMTPYYYHPWILHLIAKLLKNDSSILSLLANNPFPHQSPHFIRIETYHYRFAEKGDPSGNWWIRTRVGEYLPPLNLNHPGFRATLEERGWTS